MFSKVNNTDICTLLHERVSFLKVISFGTDVTKMSLECLASLASYVQQTKQQGTQTDQAAKHFLKVSIG